MSEKHRVLVVDDDPGMRLGMVESLRRKAFDVDEADCGEKGLLKATRQHYDVVVTDLRMPGMSGIELLTQIKNHDPATEVILVTAYGTIKSAVEATKIGAYDYILKPFSPEDLQLLVTSALTRTTPDHASNPTPGSSDIVTKSEKMLHILDMAQRAAKSHATVLIQAESGTGKELLARFICRHSARAKCAMVAINCAALPDNLLESELFGYEKGSFTGATTSKPGKFEMADKGTILLDEIGEMPMTLQSKLLRVLQEHEVDRIGSKGPRKIDVRVIAMTNQNLKDRIARGRFREDLFFRLNVIPLHIPPLRERPEDIEPLCQHFINLHAGNQAHTAALAPATLPILKRYAWPGNVRELENMIQRALILHGPRTLHAKDLFLSQSDLPDAPQTSSNGDHQLKPGTTVEEMERRLIYLTLEETEGNKTHAAKLLGISLRTLRNKLNQYESSS